MRRHRRATYWDDWDSVCPLERDVEDADYLRHLLCALTPRLMRIIVASYGLDGQPPVSALELAARDGVGRGRIYQLQHSALRRMRARHAQIVAGHFQPMAMSGNPWRY